MVLQHRSATRYNKLDKASHIERGPLIWAHNMGPYPHCYSLFHSGAPTANHSFTAGLPHFRMSKSNHSFPHWQGSLAVEALVPFKARFVAESIKMTHLAPEVSL